MKTLKIKCRKCNEVIFSEYPGHWRRCKCDYDSFIFIDQTEHYCRVGGDKEQMEFLDDAD